MSLNIKPAPTADASGYFKGKAVLITGACGYLAYHVRNLLEKASCRLFLAGNKAAPKEDVRRPDFWEPYKDVDIIFHLAAQTSVYTAQEDPIGDIQANLMPVVHFIEAMRKSGRRPDLIFAGTVTQAGLTGQLPVDESAPDQPVSVYDINKLAAEKYLEYYSRVMGGRSVTLRLANLYGPGPMGNRSDRGIVNRMIRKALAGEDLTVYGDGNFIRDYVYAQDAAGAFLSAAAHIEKISGGHYIISSGKGTSIKDMAGLVATEAGGVTGRVVAVRNIDAPEGLSPIEFRDFIGDSSRFRKATGWSAAVTLEEGVERTIRFYREENG